MFDRTSRYLGIPIATYTSPDGLDVLYVRRRMLPSLQDVGSAGTYVVRDRQRLDSIAAAIYNDPTQFWRICDGNDVLDPFDLVETSGRRIVIPPVRATQVRSSNG
jgi:hypothetical protein